MFRLRMHLAWLLLRHACRFLSDRIPLGTVGNVIIATSIVSALVVVVSTANAADVGSALARGALACVLVPTAFFALLRSPTSALKDAIQSVREQIQNHAIVRDLKTEQESPRREAEACDAAIRSAKQTVPPQPAPAFVPRQPMNGPTPANRNQPEPRQEPAPAPIRRTISCPACGNKASLAVKACPHCGHPLRRKETSVFTIAIGVVAAGVVVWIMYSSFSDDRTYRPKGGDRNPQAFDYKPDPFADQRLQIRAILAEYNFLGRFEHAEQTCLYLVTVEGRPLSATTRFIAGTLTNTRLRANEMLRVLNDSLFHGNAPTGNLYVELNELENQQEYMEIQDKLLTWIDKEALERDLRIMKRLQ